MADLVNLGQVYKPAGVAETGPGHFRRLVSSLNKSIFLLCHTSTFDFQTREYSRRPTLELDVWSHGARGRAQLLVKGR